jgi:hypothetical protein
MEAVARPPTLPRTLNPTAAAYNCTRNHTVSKSSRFKVQGSRFKVQGSKFKVQSSKFKVQSSRFIVHGSRSIRALEPLEP